MENSTKALLMAGGVLITMLIVVLLFYFKGKITEFYDEQGKIDDIANVAEFNKQFTNYERQKVYGYEIISLANMVEDYNKRHSGAENAPNDEKYTPITLTVSFAGSGNKVESQMWYDTSGDHFFSDNATYVQSDTINTIVNIINGAVQIENRYGDAQIAAKLAKSLRNLIVNENEDSYEIEKFMREQGKTKEQVIQILQKKAVEDYKALINDKTDITYSQLENILLQNGYNGISIRKYYEYYQFKRATFKCDKVEYDDVIGGSGRVKGMTFTFMKVE